MQLPKSLADMSLKPKILARCGHSISVLLICFKALCMLCFMTKPGLIDLDLLYFEGIRNIDNDALGRASLYLIFL